MANTNYEALIAALETSKEDAEKFYGTKQNAQAGKRLRAHAQTIATLAKAVRKEVQELKVSRKTQTKA